MVCPLQLHITIMHVPHELGFIYFIRRVRREVVDSMRFLMKLAKDKNPEVNCNIFNKFEFYNSIPYALCYLFDIMP